MGCQTAFIIIIIILSPSYSIESLVRNDVGNYVTFGRPMGFTGNIFLQAVTGCPGKSIEMTRVKISHKNKHSHEVYFNTTQ